MPESMAAGSEIRAIVLDFNGTLAQDDHLVAPRYVDGAGGADAARAAGMRVAVIRGLGYDLTSGIADIVVERLDPEALESMLALGSMPQPEGR